MEKDSLPNRASLRSIVVEIHESTDKKETRRVIDNSPQLNLIRRPGEGSRPLFDRDEIINGRRIYEDVGQDGRSANEYGNGNSESGFGLGTDDGGSCRGSHRKCSNSGNWTGSERYGDNSFFGSGGGACPMCHSISYCLTECGESCGTRTQARMHRTLSDGRLTGGYSRIHRYYVPAAEIESFYFYEDPRDYEEWDGSMAHAFIDYDYYSH